MKSENTNLIQSLKSALDSSNLQEIAKALEKTVSIPMNRELIELCLQGLDHRYWKTRKLCAKRLESEIAITFAHLVKHLHSSSTHTRYWLIQILPKAGNRAVAPMIDFYKEASHEEKVFILQSLQNLDHPDLIPFAIAELNHNNWSIRHQACELLSRKKSKSVTPLKKVIREGSDHQRFWGFKILGRVLGEGAMSTFATILKSKEYEDKVRTYALNGIREINTQAIIALLIETLDSDLWSLRAQASKSLIESSFPVHRLLVDSMKNGSRTLRYWGSQILQEISKEKHISMIEEFLQEEDLELRFQAITILGHIKTKESIQCLIQLLDDDTWYIRKHCCDQITTMGLIAIPALLDSLDNANEESLYWLCRIMGNIGSEQCLAGLEKLLVHMNKEIRLFALEAIYTIGGSRAAFLLTQSFDNEFWVVRSRACEYLKTPKKPSHLLPLLEGLSHPSDSISFWSQKTIEESLFYGLRTICELIRRADPSERTEMMAQLSRLTEESLQELFSHVSLKREDILKKLSSPDSLKVSAYVANTSFSTPEFNFFSQSEYPLETETRLKELLQDCVSMGGTRLHLKINCPPMTRVNGLLCKINNRALQAEEIHHFLGHYIPKKSARDFRAIGHASFYIPFTGHSRFLVHICRQGNGVEATLKFENGSLPDFHSLHLPSGFLEHLSKLPKGLILVSGPSGNGKSSLCYSLLSHINQNFVKNILTVEDQILFPMDSQKSVLSQKQVGREFCDYEEGVKILTLEDPDVIYLSRVPDYPALEDLLHLASSRCLTIVECNAGSTRAALEKILLLFPEKQLKVYEKLLQSSLQASIHIKLLNNSESNGLIPALEFFLNDSRITQSISLSKLDELSQILQNSKQDFVKSMDNYLIELASEGKISYQEAVRWMEDKSRISVDQIW